MSCDQSPVNPQELRHEGSPSLDAVHTGWTPGARGGTPPTGPVLHSHLDTSPDPPGPRTHSLPSGPRPSPHPPRGLDPREGQRGWPTVCPLPRTPAYPRGSQSRPRTRPARRGPPSAAMLHPGDMPDTRRRPSHALSTELGGLRMPRAHSLQELHNSDPGPLQPAFHTTCLPTRYFPAPIDGREQKVSGQLARPSHCPSPSPREEG